MSLLPGQPGSTNPAGDSWIPARLRALAQQIEQLHGQLSAAKLKINASQLTTTAVPITLDTDTNKYVVLMATEALPALPAAAASGRFDFYLINTTSAAITLTAAGTDKIGNGATGDTTTRNIPANSTLHIVADSTNNYWRIV